MKVTIIIFVSILINTVLLADEPPSWCEYQKENADFIAYIVNMDQDGEAGMDSGWQIEVYRKVGNEEELFWESIFYYDGYPEGHLTESGESFIFVSTWYYEEEPVVYIYNSNGDIWQYDGWEFGIPNSKLIETVSHHLWLTQEAPKYYLDTNEYDENILRIQTVDNKMHYINTYTGDLVSGNDFDEDYYYNCAEDDLEKSKAFNTLFSKRERNIFKKFEIFFYVLGILTLVLLLALIVRWMNGKN